MTSSTTTFETRWWHHDASDPTKVICTLCPRKCHIPKDGRGFCFVRANVQGELVLTTYGRSSGFCIDPIEKKPLNHFLPGTPVLSLGTAGCNLGCKFCQNWDISKSRQMDTVASQAGPKAIVQAAKTYGCRSIAFTYNDPTIWAEYAIDIAKIAREHDIKTVAVTAGYISPEARREFYRYMDAANVDLKSFSEVFYRKLTQTHLQPVLDTLKYLKHETDVWFEITNLIIPQENDSTDELKAMCDWIVKELGTNVPVHFSAFHPDYKMVDRPVTPHETLIQAREIALDAGIQFAYLGNVYDLERESTYCPSCGKMLIERDWYQLGQYHLKGNCCDKCHTQIPGVFEAGSQVPGQWGRKRQPIAINDHRQYVSLTHKKDAALSYDLSLKNIATESKKMNLKKEASSTTVAELATQSQKAMMPKLDFTDEQITQILSHTRALVQAAVKQETLQIKLPHAIAEAPAFGLFVTLKRDGQLRACRGRWGGSSSYSFGELLAEVAIDTATNDGRFPRIALRELEMLELEVSIMHDPQPLSLQGQQLNKPLDEACDHSLTQQLRKQFVQQVVVGKHGLVIALEQSRGLFLPHVATESGWDAETFLNEVCVKAGLPKETWYADSHAALMTFKTRLLILLPAQQELDMKQFNANRYHQLIKAADHCLAGGQDFSVDDSWLTKKWPDELGICLQTQAGLTASAFGANQTLAELTVLAVQSLRNIAGQSEQTQSQTIKTITLFLQAIRLNAADYPSRFRSLGFHAILAEAERNWSLQQPLTPQPTDQVTPALEAVGLSGQYWQQAQMAGHIKPRLTAFRLSSHQAENYPMGLKQRQAAQAGKFYPTNPDEITKEVCRWLKVKQTDLSQPQPCRAVMLPHAGWFFCGETIGKTLHQVKLPKTVIIIGPKHTPYGANWSVPPHQSWALPGGEVAIASDLASEMIEAISGLQCDADAHQLEHGSEVLLPFLQQINPSVRVLPIAMGHTNYDGCVHFANGLAQVLARHTQVGDPPLVIISSDMNHFATDVENRRLDQLALDALCNGDPHALYTTCQTNQISMCGLLPAVSVMLALQKTTPAISPCLIDYRTSAQASGDTQRVVGYAGVTIH